MGDTMRMPKPAAYIIKYVMNEPDVSFCKREGHECEPLFTEKQLQAAHEAGRRLGMDQANALWEMAKSSQEIEAMREPLTDLQIAAGYAGLFARSKWQEESSFRLGCRFAENYHLITPPAGDSDTKEN